MIHCMVGVSRSVTIAIAYFLRKYSYTLGQVIGLIQRKRRKVKDLLDRSILILALSPSCSNIRNLWGLSVTSTIKKCPPSKNVFFLGGKRHIL